MEFHGEAAFDDNYTTSNRMKNGGIKADKQTDAKQTN